MRSTRPRLLKAGVRAVNNALFDVTYCAGRGGTLEESESSPSAIVGCARTASRSTANGKAASIAVCTAAMTSPASAPIIVTPRMRSSLPPAYWPGCGSLVNRAGKATRLERHRRGKTWRGNYSWVARRSQSTTAGERGVRLGPGWLRRARRSGGQAGLPYDIHNGRNFPEQDSSRRLAPPASPARSPARWAALSGEGSILNGVMLLWFLLTAVACCSSRWTSATRRNLRCSNGVSCC